MCYLVTRSVFPCPQVPVAVVTTQGQADMLIMSLERKDPKGVIVFYTRESLEDSSPILNDVKSTALALANFE